MILCVCHIYLFIHKRNTLWRVKPRLTKCSVNKSTLQLFTSTNDVINHTLSAEDQDPVVSSIGNN